MKRIVFVIIACLLMASSFECEAQRSQRSKNGTRTEEWLGEMRNLKHDFLIKELGLTREQQNAFFPIYDEMEDELNKISKETRALEKKAQDSADMPEAEAEALARSIYSQKQREGNVEMAYFERFKSILKPNQLLILKASERKFLRVLFEERGNKKRH